MKYYRSTRWKGGEIKEVEIDRETAYYVFIDGRRTSKVKDWESYHETREAAKAHLLAIAETRLKAIESKLRFAKQNLEAVRAL